MNQLGSQTSPYLLQHAENPVEWWPWSPEAFAAARERDVPVLLSIGYAACHWCHVMAHESFEDEATARYMNEHFVNIKVDREERPDVDAVYMEATQAMTGAGGWPMTCFLTPDGEPFYCGTYFPPTPVHGMPAFVQVLRAIEQTWRERRADVHQASSQVVEALSAVVPTGGQVPDAAALDEAVRVLAEQADTEAGGFGHAPKFPPSMVLEFLLRHAARTELDQSLDQSEDPALALAEHTFEAMARGGIYDQLGGGFARYAVDRFWVVPHFEKMLYDNALLLRAYLHWHRLTGSTTAERIARETADFLLRELRTPEGGFASSLDADSEGVEGKFYVWTPEQLADIPGAAELFGVTEQGTFEHGTSTLQLPADPADWQWYADIRARLLARREERVRPGRDDKVVVAWNAMAITALAETGALLNEPAYVDAATEAAQLLVDLHTGAGDGGDQLIRTSRHGLAGTSAGVLEDYAHLAEAYLMLLSVTGEPGWLTRAGSLLDAILTRFTDEGAFYDTASDAEQLVKRPQDPTDAATPSGRFAAAGALSTYSAVTGSHEHRQAAEQALGIAGRLAARAPRACGWGLAAAEARVAGPLEIAVVGPAGDPGRASLHAVALGATSPGAVTVVGTPDRADVPLLAGRGLVDGLAAAYVCRGFVCDRPVTDPHELGGRIGAWRGRGRSHG